MIVDGIVTYFPFVFYIIILSYLLTAFVKPVRDFIAPVNEEEHKWYYTFGRATVSILIFTLPFAYDPFVPEVAGDIRWYIMHFTGLLLVTSFFVYKFIQTRNIENFTFNFKLPLTAWAAFICVLFGALTISWGLSLPNNWWFFKNLAGYVLIFSFALHLRHETWYKHLVWILLPGVAFNGGLGILNFFAVSDVQIANILPFIDKVHFINFFQQAAPPAGAFSNKNLAASFMLMCLPLMTYLILTAKNNLKLVLSTLAFTLAAILLIYTRSRGSWVSAAALVIFAIIWLTFNDKTRDIIIKQFNMKKSIALLSAIFVIVFASSYKSNLQNQHSMHTTVSQQFSSIYNIQKHELDARWAYNINGIDILMDNPLGTGLGGFHTIYPKYFNSSTLTPINGYNLNARPRRMHNDIFQAFIELGILGGLAHLFVFASPLFMAWRISKEEKIPEKTKMLSFFTLLAIGGMSVNALGDFPLQMPTAPAVLWLLIGIITGLYVIHIKNSEFGKIIRINMPSKFVFASLSIISAIVLGLITHDDYNRREGAMYLKPAMALSRSGRNDDTALYFITKSHKNYILNPREREMHSVILMNHKKNNTSSKANITFEMKLKALQESLKHDPYAQNALINISMLHLRKAQAIQKNNSNKNLMSVEASKHILLAHEYAKRAVPLSYYRANAHTVYAITLLYLNKGQEAYNHFQKALSINPEYTPAIEYIKKLQPFINAGKIKEKTT